MAEAPGRAPLGIVQRGPDELAAHLATEWGFAEALFRKNGELLRLEPYQRAFLQSRSPYRWCAKSRQVGFSFVFAVEALARCHLRPQFTAVLVSYNLEDAKEKIEVARQLYFEMPWQFRKKLITDSKTELVFEALGRRPGRSRIVSAPSKAPRGKGGHVYLDELAHYQDARAVYGGSTASISRVRGGQLSAASTPLGRQGIFWEIHGQENRAYPHHWRQEVPWWICSSFSTETRLAAHEAPHLTTEQRVERFATEQLRAQFEALELSEFQQEFECSFVAESIAFFPYELVLACVNDDLALAPDWTDIGELDGRLVAGFDVGRRTDRSELALFEQRGERFTCLALRSFVDVPFATQEAEVRRMLELLPIARLSIDSGGIGMHLAENLARDYPQVVREKFSAESKERWATDLKLLMQRRLVELPRDRDLIRQLHSIERHAGAAGRVAIDAPSTRRGHADRFWAVALACQKERAAVAGRAAVVTATVVGAADRVRDAAELFPDGVVDAATGEHRRAARWS